MRKSLKGIEHMVVFGKLYPNLPLFFSALGAKNSQISLLFSLKNDIIITRKGGR